MKKKSIFKIKKPWQAVVAGIIAGVVSVGVILCVLAAVLVNYDIPAEYVRYLLAVPAVLSGIIAGAITGKNVKSRSFLWGSGSALAVSIMLLLILLIVNSFSIDWISFLLLPIFVFSGSVGGIVSSNLK